jgi:hypothetical protein
MTAPSERRVDIVATRLDGQRFERLIGKHRFVLIQFRSGGETAPARSLVVPRRARFWRARLPCARLAASERQRVELRGQTGAILALEPDVATLVPARLVPQLEAITLTDQHRVPSEPRERAQLRRQ